MDTERYVVAVQYLINHKEWEAEVVQYKFNKMIKRGRMRDIRKEEKGKGVVYNIYLKGGHNY